MKIKKLLAALAALLLLGGCTGSCTAGTQTAVPTVTPPPVDSAPPAPETPHTRETPVLTPSPEPDEPVPVEPVPMPTASVAETVPPSSPPEPLPTPTPEPAYELSDEAVLNAYHQAVEAFGWFQLTHLPLDMETEAVVEEQVYYRVDCPGLETLAELRGYLKNLFSDALVEELLPAGSGAYIEVDGVLYGQDGGRGTDLTRGAETLQVLRNGESRCTVHVSVEVLDPEQDYAVVGSEVYEFPYEKIGEQWIFTAFSLVR